MGAENAQIIYLLNMIFVLVLCAGIPQGCRVLHMVGGIAFVVLNTPPQHLLLYGAILFVNLFSLRVRALSAYPLLFFNLSVLILTKAFSVALGIDIESKNNITIQLILLVPKMFYLSQAGAGLFDSLCYIFFLPAIMAGPVIPYEQYAEGVVGGVRKEERKPRVQGHNVVVQKLVQTALFGCIMCIVEDQISIDSLIRKKRLWMRVLLLYIYGVGFRSRYHMVWTFSSACYALCGLDVVNITFWKVEYPPTLRSMSKYWNTYLGAFLKKSIFERFRTRGIGLARASTFVTSSLLHGGHPCYFMMFLGICMGFVPLGNSRQLAEAYLWPWLATFLNVTNNVLFLCYVSVPFYVLDVWRAVFIWKSVSWYGHWMLLVLYAVYFARRLLWLWKERKTKVE